MSLQHIILGNLKLVGSLSGYDLKQQIDQSTQHFWYCDLSQIYRALDSITAQGWATVQEDEESSRQRKIYTITPDGEAALAQWLAEDFEISPSRNNMLARIFYGKYGTLDRQREQITHLQDQMKPTLGEYHAIKTLIHSMQAQFPVNAAYWLLTVDLGIRFTQAYLDWCEATLNKLDEIEELRENS